ncbi:unnamed protein product [Ranitomeya imitator]|uniref:Nck-associated protein 1 n=1 Tax=Ranitomeya imitator TaxID=111125 RepID=A0ABN9MF34_9NEOB|nr:unnamed protein product [Ranitomeya imitator]
MRGRNSAPSSPGHRLGSGCVEKLHPLPTLCTIFTTCVGMSGRCIATAPYRPPTAVLLPAGRWRQMAGALHMRSPFSFAQKMPAARRSSRRIQGHRYLETLLRQVSNGHIAYFPAMKAFVNLPTENELTFNAEEYSDISKLVVENVEVLTQMRTSFDKPEQMAALFKRLSLYGAPFGEQSSIHWSSSYCRGSRYTMRNPVTVNCDHIRKVSSVHRHQVFQQL